VHEQHGTAASCSAIYPPGRETREQTTAACSRPKGVTHSRGDQPECQTNESPSVFRKEILMSSSDTSLPTPKEPLGPEPRRRTGVCTAIWMGLLWLVVIAVALFPFPWWW
jgi:hypothetical protein